MRTFIQCAVLLVALAPSVARADEPAPTPQPSASGAPATPVSPPPTSGSSGPIDGDQPPREPVPSLPAITPDADAAATEPKAPVSPPPDAPIAKPQRATLGGVGASCRKRRECGEHLHCLRNTCVDEAAFQASRPQPHRELSRPRGTFGGSLGFSVPTISNRNVGESLQAALRVGFIYERFQLRLDVSPGSTAIFNVADDPIGMFDAVGSAAYLIRLSDMASWVLRFGGGGGFVYGVPHAQTAGFGEVRADLIGIAIHTSDHLLVEFDAPSYRIMIPAGAGTLSMMWMTNVGLDYVF